MVVKQGMPVKDGRGRAARGRGRRGTAVAACLAAAGFLVLFIIAAGCAGTGTPQETAGTQEPLTVAVTILPQKQFVERIAGDHARVVVLVPPGASPHTYEPTPQQLAAVSGAALYVEVGSGLGFERAWMDRLAGVSPGMRIVDSSEGISLLAGMQDEDETAGGADPHIWLSPRNAQLMVENTYRGLAEADPAHGPEYRANKEAYQRELSLLDENITRDLSRSGVTQFMVYHPAWAYFARDYGLVQVPIEQEGKEPTPQGIENLIEQARASNSTVIFASPESSTRSAGVIAEAIGGRVVLVSPLAEDYVTNMREAARAFSMRG